MNTSLTTADVARTGRTTEFERPADSTPQPAVPPKVESTAPLLDEKEIGDFRHRWDDIQAAFVDEPRQSVQQADTLVAEAIKRLAEIFAEERSRLEGQWARGDNVSTEDLRMALQRYRSFFTRLLSI